MADIIVAFPRQEDGERIRLVLQRGGHNVIAVARSGTHVLKMSDRLTRGIVVCAYKLTDMVYTDLCDILPRAFQMIVVTSQARLDDARDDRVVIEPTPLKAHSLLATIEMVEETGARRRMDRRPRKRSKEEEELLLSAKALLMDKNHMTEDEAHKYLRRKSMESGSTIIETAEKVFLLYH